MLLVWRKPIHTVVSIWIYMYRAPGVNPSAARVVPVPSKEVITVDTRGEVVADLAGHNPTD